MQQMIFIADLIACSTCFVLLARKPDTQPSAPHHTDNLKTKAPYTTGSNHLHNTLELPMMGTVVHETCWASNKICNKNHLLHLVGILFPHINDDARSKSHQIYICMHLWPWRWPHEWPKHVDGHCITKYVIKRKCICWSSTHFMHLIDARNMEHIKMTLLIFVITIAMFEK